MIVINYQNNTWGHHALSALPEEHLRYYQAEPGSADRTELPDGAGSAVQQLERHQYPEEEVAGEHSSAGCVSTVLPGGPGSTE